MQNEVATVRNEFAGMQNEVAPSTAVFAERKNYLHECSGCRVEYCKLLVGYQCMMFENESGSSCAKHYF